MHPWWETLLLDAAGVVVTLVVSAAVLWLTHRTTGLLAGPLRKLGEWVDRNTPTVSRLEGEAVAELRKLLDEWRASQQHLPVTGPAARSIPVYYRDPPDMPGRTAGS